MDDYSSDEDFIVTKPAFKGILNANISSDILYNIFMYVYILMVMFCFHCLAEPRKTNTPAAAHHPFRKPLSQCDSPVFISDSDDDDNIVVKSTWRTRHLKPEASSKTNKNKALLLDEDAGSPSLSSHPVSSPFLIPAHKTPAFLASPKRTLSAPSKLEESASSEEEFTSLLERLKKKNNLTVTSFTPKNSKGNYQFSLLRSTSL